MSFKNIDSTSINDVKESPSLRNRTNSCANDASKTETKLQNAIFCQNCSPKMCDPCQHVLIALAQRSEECSQRYDISAFQVAIRRMPALLLTMALELVGKEYANWFKMTAIFLTMAYR